MPAIDYGALKAQTLKSGAEEEAVTVNTRALIDKVLARYSSDWTVLRELLQNAADANATRVMVKIETLPPVAIPSPATSSTSDILKHVVAHHTVKRLVITNNGSPFSENDWSRLKRIAEGNPDETKIGAFGVGFYSVFADCEEPFVSSGDQAMAFYWRGNSLFTRRSRLDTTNKDTMFVLDYRSSTSPVPALLPVSQFLATSLSFVGIEDIELWLDDHKVLFLSKKSAPFTSIDIPKGIETRTRESMMKVGSVSRQVAQIDATWMGIIEWKVVGEVSRSEPAPLRSFFSKIRNVARPKEEPVKVVEVNLASSSSGTIFVDVTSATIETSVTKSFAQELERATKKPPPRTTRLSILTSPFVSGSEHEQVFATVLPAKSGRVFIGFPTHQTTGLRAHLSAPSVIPTVERESIDLNARWVRTWNAEILRAAGILCRIAWSAEMAAIQKNVKRKMIGSEKTKIRAEHVTPFIGDAVHSANTYSFQESTPSDQIRQMIEDAFWTCNTTATIEVLSSCGVLPNHEIRITPNLTFMDDLPTLPEGMKAAKPFVDRLVEFGLLTEVTPKDIRDALVRCALSSQQLHEFLEWLAAQLTSKKFDEGTVRDLLGVAVADIQSGSNHKVLVLGTIKYFVDPGKITPDLPVSELVMPFEFSKGLSVSAKEAFGWRQLPLVTWVEWLLTEKIDMFDPPLAAKVLALVSKQWESVKDKGPLISALSAHAVIPTKLGMRKPGDAYFPSVRVFDDLPVVFGLQGVKERVLLALGVRKTLELSLVFSRLSEVSQKSQKHLLIVVYLASVQEDIPPADLERLKTTPLCPREGSDQRFVISSLYEPDQTLRELGLPILDWTNGLRKGSPESRFLNRLGLKSVPSVEELIDIMAGSDRGLVAKAMSYFIANHYKNIYGKFDYGRVTRKFLPIQGSAALKSPSECYTDSGAALFGFDVLDERLHAHAAKFGVSVYPPISECIDFMASHPPSSKAAREVFTYFAGRLNEINALHISRLFTAKFIPLSKGRRASPGECFLGTSEEFEGLFDYVDFGPDANSFLFKVGTKREPNKTEIAMILISQPQRIFEAQDHEKYLGMLASLADSVKFLKKDKQLFAAMKKASFLPATKYVAIDGDDDEPDSIKEWQLTSARKAVVIDDFPTYQIFKGELLAAPQEKVLEEFYLQLGAPRLSELVEEKTTYGDELDDQRGAQKLREKILERSKLFLHEQVNESIKYDTRWLESNLEVIAVSSIKVRRTIKGLGLQNVEERSAATTQGRKAFLCISGRTSYYEISQCLVHWLLRRPTLHHPLTLEMLLTTDLKDLGNRGFNVTRILRKKEAERRFVQQQLAEEQQRVEAAKASEKGLEALPNMPRGKSNIPSKPVPGAFPGSSPPAPSNLPFYDLRKSLGLSLDSEAVPKPLSLTPKSPPAQKGPIEAPQRPLNFNPQEISRSLTQAIQSSRTVSTAAISNSSQNNTLTEPLTYCDLKPGTDLRFAATTSQGMKIFLTPSVTHPLDFIAANPGLELFATLLIDVATIFPRLDIGCVSIFIGDDEPTIAFNRAGSTFANYAFFQRLHLPTLVRGGGLPSGKAGVDALLYWWITMCHELAHNLVREHSARHSYYLENFVTEYMAGLTGKMTEYQARGWSGKGR